MAAYGLEDRFPEPRHCFRMTDPAAYDREVMKPFNQNKYGFMSSAPRKTAIFRKPYTDTISSADIPPRIPNVTSLRSKTPRFPYDALTPEDIQSLICRCQMECECPVEDDEKEEIVCQAKVPKRLFKGPPPHSNLGESLSCPSKRDYGFEILPDGTMKRILKKGVDDQPFYETRVNWATDFYHGWKWGSWKSKREIKTGESRPGPADYTLRRERSDFEKCLDQIRAHRRKHAKFLRYIEQLQDNAIRCGPPGPADYDPQLPKGTNMKYLGPKAERFPVSQLEARPGPAAHSIKRDFDLPERTIPPCFAAKGPYSCFGVSSKRFQYRTQKLPGPADYDANVKVGKFKTYIKGAFGVSARRFSALKFEEILSDEEEDRKPCTMPTWQFRSLSKRFRDNNNIDADFMALPKPTAPRSLQNQYLAPFGTSQGRFQPWYDWLPITAGLETPGPGYYNARKLKCLSAVPRGPLYRTEPRIPYHTTPYPAPNEYKVGGGVETVLATHNKRLQQNMKTQHKFNWKLEPETRHYSAQEKELLIIEKAIEQLEVDKPAQKEKMAQEKKEERMNQRREYLERIKCICDKKRRRVPKPTTDAVEDAEDVSEPKTKPIPECVENAVRQLEQLDEAKPKLLRTFLYSHQQIQCV